MSLARSVGAVRQEWNVALVNDGDALHLVGGLGDGAQLQIDAVQEHGFDLEEGFIFGVELRAAFDLAKGGLEDGETVPRIQYVDEILGFDAAHGGTFVSMET